MNKVNETRFEAELMVIDLDQMICLHCSPEFYRTVCWQFVGSTIYRDPYEMLEYFMGEEDEHAWKGFPAYMKAACHAELFTIFHLRVDGGGITPQGFSAGDDIHPMFPVVLEHLGYAVMEEEWVMDHRKKRIGIVKETETKGAAMDSNKRKIHNKEIFEDTMGWIDEDADLSAAVDWSKQHTAIIYDSENPVFDAECTEAQDVEISKRKTFDAARALQAAYPQSKIAVLNFANPIKPGGAVEVGFAGQEESLCRCSTLYKILSDAKVCGGYYQYNQSLKSYASSDSLIYTEGVVICKTDDVVPMRIAKEDWVKVDIMTLAAPYTGDDVMDSCDAETLLDEESLYAAHVKRAKHMFAAAASKGADVLVLGAFGCGAFKNNPYVVAKAYKTALSAFPKVFKKIEFAIYCAPGAESENYQAFAEILK